LADPTRSSRDARSARSASSSCTTGTPNTAITASPGSRLALPPCAVTIAVIRSNELLMAPGGR